MIRFENVTHNYPDKELFHNYNCRIKEGEKILLRSPSGTGKSTFMKMIMGFIEPQNGRIFFHGEEVNERNIEHIRSQIIYLPQTIAAPRITVREFLKDILTYQINSHISYDEDDIIERLHELRLRKRILNMNFSDLTTGEKQRIGIIIVDLLDRPVLLLDEITSALNEFLREVIVEHYSHKNNTIIVISHDICWKNSEFRQLRW